MTINVPTSMLKKMLASNGARVSPEAVLKFKTKMLQWADEVSKQATEKAGIERRKTIFPGDLE